MWWCPCCPRLGEGIRGWGLGLENNCFTEMCSGSEAGSYLRPMDFVYHSTLGLRVVKSKESMPRWGLGGVGVFQLFFFVFITLKPRVE